MEQVRRELGQLPRPLTLYLAGEVRGAHRVLASTQRPTLTYQVSSHNDQAPLVALLTSFLQRFLRMLEDAHLKLLYEAQEEARQQLMKEQELALSAIMEQDRRLAAEKQEDQEVGRRREQLLVSLSLADRDRLQIEMKAAAQRLPAEPSPTEDHIQVR